MSTPVGPSLAAWLQRTLRDAGPFVLEPLMGGNSNETLLLRSPTERRVLRRPPAAPIGPGAHAIEREHGILAALHGAGAPVPAPLALCTDPEVAPAPFLVMECVDGVVGDAVSAGVGPAVVDALATVHAVDWRAAGLAGVGRPEGFLERQPGRWQAQLDRHGVRALPQFDRVTRWLGQNVPPAGPPTVIHGDFRLDNCIITRSAPAQVAAVIDWELATVGDPLMDLGLLLAFWGTDRAQPYAMPARQRLSRAPGAPSREALADRYAELTGRDMTHLRWYMGMALLKLASIIEGAYAQHLAGRLDSAYARDLEYEVPRLVDDAAYLVGL